MNPKTILEGIAGGVLVSVSAFMVSVWTENQKLKNEIEILKDRVLIYKTLTVLGVIGTYVGLSI
tara:strand:+ start:122 stop:313 length:192 start_codon:yes stop_codon:yes gene_type:complete